VADQLWFMTRIRVYEKKKNKMVRSSDELENVRMPMHLPRGGSRTCVPLIDSPELGKESGQRFIV